MKNSTSSITLHLIAASLFSSMAVAAVYDESVNGDLSNDPSATTFIDFEVGKNTVTGSLLPRETGVTTGLPQDPDFFWFTLQPGYILDSITLDSFESGDVVGAAQAFFAIQEGSTVDVTGGGLLAGAVFGATPGAQVGDEVLDDLAAGDQIGGFSGPLGPDASYAFWIQETAGPDPTTYSLSFNVTSEPVPEPTSLATMGGCLVALAIYGLKRRKQH